ncbi:MAG: alkyl hydroperoxide reductase, partial [Dehalococcoidia bacterium]|nr:alkyl hydroperoxide reductase [Dehalococcoidia bacterium]
FDVSYPQLLDEDGEVSNGYRVGLGLPITFILDPAGVILRVHVGPLDLAQMRALQAELSG